jgi:DNA-binding SARP family transcriptional activator
MIGELGSLRFTLLGAVGIEDARGVHHAMGAGKTQTLFAHLLVKADELVTSQQIREELWPGSEAPKTANTAIQIYVSKLRRSIASFSGKNTANPCIQTKANGYILPLADHQHDLAEFRHLTMCSRDAENRGDLSEAAELLHRALGLWHGEPLDDVTCGPILTRAARTLSEMRMSAFEHRIKVDLRLGRHADLIGEIYALVSEFPLWEQAYAYLMTALYRSGRTADSLNVYHQLRQRLVEELGLEPSLEVQRLQAAILARDSKLGAAPFMVKVS